MVVNNRLLLLSNAFPVMTTTSWAPLPTQVTLEGATLPVARITSIDLMARRRLKDDMPGIMLRATIRSTVSATLQYQAQRAADRESTLALALAAGVDRRRLGRARLGRRPHLARAAVGRLHRPRAPAAGQAHDHAAHAARRAQRRA